ncbi:MAG: hypothetical protein ACYTFZ_06630, partial [Planctomycetota bacterium]
MAHQRDNPTWQLQEDAKREVRLTCWCGLKAWNSETARADGVRPGYCSVDHQAAWPQWGPPPGQQWYRTFLCADGASMVANRQPCSRKCGRAARQGHRVCCASCGSGHEPACNAEWAQVRAVGGYGRLTAACNHTEAAAPPAAACSKCGQRKPYALDGWCGVCLFGAELAQEAVEPCAAGGAVRVYCSHHLTLRSQQVEQEWLPASSQKKASRPPFNTRYLTPPAEPDVETYDMPSFGVALPRQILAIFERPEMRSTLAKLRVPEPVQTLNAVVQSKLSKVEELCEFLRWQAASDPGVDLQAVGRMHAFATRVRQLTPEEVKTPEDWTKLVDGLVHRDYSGRWAETRLLHTQNVMLIFGFSVETQRKYAATALVNDASQTWAQYLRDQHPAGPTRA